MTDQARGAFKRRVGTIFTQLGAAVGSFGVFAMLVKLKIELSPDAQQILFYKGLFAGAAVLLVLGAIYGRQGRVEQEEARTTSSLPSGSSLTSSSHDAGALPGHYSTSEPESPERQYERRDREIP